MGNLLPDPSCEAGAVAPLEPARGVLPGLVPERACTNGERPDDVVWDDGAREKVEALWAFSRPDC